MGFKYCARNADNIADIHQLNQGIIIFSQYVFAGVKLDFPGTVLQIDKAGFAVAADCHHTAGSLDNGSVRFHLLHIFINLFGMMGPVKPVTERADSPLFQLVHLVNAVLHLFINVHYRSLFSLNVLLVFCHSVSPDYLILTILY